MTIWLILEWLGTFFALAGSVVLASKIMPDIIGWSSWIISNILLIILFFFHTEQAGLVFMQLANILINIMGICLYYKKTNLEYSRLGSVLYYMSLSLIVGACAFFIFFLSDPLKQLSSIEWMGGLISVSAALLLASYHQKAKFCWALWILGNIIILILTSYTKQYGFMTLQIGFSIINFYGAWIWLIKPYLKFLSTVKTPLC